MLPTKYTPQNDFQSLDNAIGVQLDRNFSALALSISSVIDVLTVLSRSDSKLANSTVHIQALTDELYKYIQGRSSWNLKGAWQAYRRYEYGDIVQFGATAYGCCVTHGASDVFINDANAGSWQILTGDNGNTPTLTYVDTADQAIKTNILATVAGIYESSSHAATIYATNAVLNSLFLTISAATSTFLTIQAAANTYATLQQLSNYAQLNSPALVGLPTAPTPTTGDFSKKIATTEFLKLNFDPVGSMAVFTASGTWTVPAGIRKCKVTVIGGGGGSAGTGRTSSFGVYCSATGGSGINGGVGLSGDLNGYGGDGISGDSTFGNGGTILASGGAGATGHFGYGYGAYGITASSWGSMSAVGENGGGGGGIAIKTINSLFDGQSITITVGGAGWAGAGAGVVIVEY